MRKRSSPLPKSGGYGSGKLPGSINDANCTSSGRILIFMVRMTVLASGSKGNSTIVSSSKTRILVDAGLSCRELFKRMAVAGEDPTTLDAILITHEHQDHIQGLSVAARKLGIPVYFTEATHRAWVRWMTPRKTLSYGEWLEQRRAEKLQRESAPQDAVLSGAVPGSRSGRDQGEQSSESIKVEAPTGADLASLCSEDEDPQASKADANPSALPAIEYFRSGSDFAIGDIQIQPFTIPHDAADPCGFVFVAEGIRLAIATDLGYMPSNVQMQLRRCDVLMIESNHDIEMLRDGPYPWSVKQRVMSRVGHLSNDAAAQFLQKTYDGHATYVVLAHLSESNNLPELARVAAEYALRDRMNLLGNKLLLAQQRMPLESISL